MSILVDVDVDVDVDEHRSPGKMSAPFGAVAVAALIGALLFASCGYSLAQTGRTVRLSISAHGPVRPDAVPAVQAAIARRLREEGMRIGTGPHAEDLELIVVAAEEAPEFPAGSAAAGFEAAAWLVRLRASARMHTAQGRWIDLGEFEADGLERPGRTAASDGAAQRSAFAAAAEELAERIVGAVLGAR